MKKSSQISLLILGILAALAILMASCSKSETALKPQIKPLMEAVYSSGFIVSGDEYQVFAQTEGVLKEKLVADGSNLSKGQALFIIEGAQQNARMQFAQEAYQVAQRNARLDGPILKEAFSALQNAKSKLNYDSANFIRYQNLISERATSQVEFDRTKLSYENSLNDYQIRKSSYQKLKDQTALELQNTSNNLKIAQDENARYTIKSELDGMLFKSMKEAGELVKKGELLATIGKPKGFYFKMKIDELDVQRVKSGQDVVVKIDAYPNQIFKAKVSKVYPIVDPRDQSIRVDASLIDTLPGYYSGLAAEGNIIIQEKEHALVISRTLLLPGDSVLIKTQEGNQLVKVQKGVETLSEVEIISGLSADTELVNQ